MLVCLCTLGPVFSLVLAACSRRTGLVVRLFDCCQALSAPLLCTAPVVASSHAHSSPTPRRRRGQRQKRAVLLQDRVPRNATRRSVLRPPRLSLRGPPAGAQTVEPGDGHGVSERRPDERPIPGAAADAPRETTDGGHRCLRRTHHHVVGLPLLRRLPRQTTEHERRELAPHDLGVPRCCGAFTPSMRLVSIRRGRGWFLF